MGSLAFPWQIELCVPLLQVSWIQIIVETLVQIPLKWQIFKRWHQNISPPLRHAPEVAAFDASQRRTSFSEDDDDNLPAAKSTHNKKSPPPPMVGQYLLVAQTFLGVQRVHVETKEVSENAWSADLVEALHVSQDERLYT
jgi:hypothetical protein